jgi:hypothetical protein
MVEEFSAKDSPAKSGMRSDNGNEGCNYMVGLSRLARGALSLLCHHKSAPHVTLCTILKSGAVLV